MTKPRRVHPLTLAAAFALLIALLGSMVFAALHHGTPVRFGLAPGAQAFGTARLLQYASPQYTPVMYSEEDTVLRALDNHLLDAALISAESALALPEDTYEIRGVFSVTDLLVLSNEETVLNLQSLSGRTLIVPQTLQGSKEESMLLQLLQDADTAGINLVYARSLAATWQQHPGAVVLVSLHELDTALSALPALSVRFRLSSAWRDLYFTVPPAGHCIVARRDINGTGTFTAFEKHLRDSMTYADRKRKKTIAMAVEAGIFSNETQAEQLIDHMSFTYHEGKDMKASLAAFEALQ